MQGPPKSLPNIPFQRMTCGGLQPSDNCDWLCWKAWLRRDEDPKKFSNVKLGGLVASTPACLNDACSGLPSHATHRSYASVVQDAIIQRGNEGVELGCVERCIGVKLGIDGGAVIVRMGVDVSEKGFDEVLRDTFFMPGNTGVRFCKVIV